MKILFVESLALPEVKVIRFGRFRDARGYFTESFRREDFEGHADLAFLWGERFVQTNESYSRAGTLRGLHFQWEPVQGKLVRTLHGHMVDVVVDIRPDSPRVGKAVMYDLRNDDDAEFGEWIWVPPGFAHGTWFPTASRIEYLCTAAYNPAGEGAISPFADDLDWSMCEPVLKAGFDALVAGGNLLISDKDRAGVSLRDWLADPRASRLSLAD